jgi:hypothetical protein
VFFFIVHKLTLEDLGSRLALNTNSSKMSWCYFYALSQMFPYTKYLSNSLQNKMEFKI